MTFFTFLILFQGRTEVEIKLRLTPCVGTSTQEVTQLWLNGSLVRSLLILYARFHMIQCLEIYLSLCLNACV